MGLSNQPIKYQVQRVTQWKCQGKRWRAASMHKRFLGRKKMALRLTGGPCLLISIIASYPRLHVKFGPIVVIYNEGYIIHMNTHKNLHLPFLRYSRKKKNEHPVRNIADWRQPIFSGIAEGCQDRGTPTEIQQRSCHNGGEQTCTVHANGVLPARMHLKMVFIRHKARKTMKTEFTDEIHD